MSTFISTNSDELQSKATVKIIYDSKYKEEDKHKYWIKAMCNKLIRNTVGGNTLK